MAVTVVNGTASPSRAQPGDIITIIADKPTEFVQWTGYGMTGSGILFANAFDSTTTFVMPDYPVTVWARYRGAGVSRPPVGGYNVTVRNGTADKSKAYAGETVTVTADMPASGKTFDQWTGDVELENANAAETTFEMPAKAVTVKATFKKLPSVKMYWVTVVNGKADKTKAAAGEIVTLTANPPPAGKVFDRWTGGATFDNPNAMETTFVMPAKAVTPKALYKRK